MQATKHLLIGGSSTKVITSDNLFLSDADDDSSTPTTGRALADHVAWLYRCVQLRGYALSSLPWVIQSGDETVWDSQEATAPAGLAWLDDLTSLLYLTECSLCLTGEAFWFLPKRSQAPRWLTPSTRISPAVGSSRPAMSRSVVDFPHPDGPTRTTNSSSAMSRSMPRTASTSP